MLLINEGNSVQDPMCSPPRLLTSITIFDVVLFTLKGVRIFFVNISIYTFCNLRRWGRITLLSF